MARVQANRLFSQSMRLSSKWRQAFAIVSAWFWCPTKNYRQGLQAIVLGLAGVEQKTAAWQALKPTSADDILAEAQVKAEAIIAAAHDEAQQVRAGKPARKA